LRQRRPIQPGPAQVLHAMAQVQEVSPAASELPRQLGGGRPLREPAQDQNDLRWPPMGTLEDGPGPGVEDPAALGAAIIKDGLTEVTMGVESLGGVAARAAQPRGVEQIEEELVAGIFIHEILDREIHRRDSWDAGCPFS